MRWGQAGQGGAVRGVVEQGMTQPVGVWRGVVLIRVGSRYFWAFGGRVVLIGEGAMASDGSHKQVVHTRGKRKS